MSIETKKKIETALQAFVQGNLTKNALGLFTALDYTTDRQASLTVPKYAEFKTSFVEPNINGTTFSEDKALVKEWKYVDLLFQLSKDEITPRIDLFDTKQVDQTIIETYLFFVIELTNLSYTRTTLSQITREINKLFPMPVMVLFKHDTTLTLSIINRRRHKTNDSKDVLEKVTLIKDIDIITPHRGHIDILFDLSFNELERKHRFTNFVELQNAWQKTLDTKELNKRFYQDLSNWYFWAMQHVTFPSDVEKDESVRNATNLIRLITRIIFVWFIKEKNLIPEKLFLEPEIKLLLKEFRKKDTSHSYYLAILQNLFFGTLNQTMKNRRFADDSNDYVKKDHGIKTLFRYKDLFAVGEKEILSLFSTVPFLNGGLFDCLDKDDSETGKHVLIDGFTRNTSKQAVVPDFLFFSDERDIDLNKTYGTHNKKYKAKGLINILTGYKFTITENTPIEEEVALDPELLGKVFENLLASYNPETQTTARKQTGSFYTPREIVNYMVDESLKAYLKQALADKLNMTEADANTGLEILFSYTELEHAFSEKEIKVLIDAIDSCTILDPACGSGAFPMGILHKLVHILHKLDPHNKQWKERQVQKARTIDDIEARNHAIEDIEAAFGNNELDYGRKLFLIENCIYGIDIQPIAVQIAKLRFFISLVVDQKKQEGKDNLGIRSLPNLETKFVAANTLIGLKKPKDGDNVTSFLSNPEIPVLENKLKELRHRYFGAKTRKEKQICQKEDKTLRQKISTLLEQDGWEHNTAQQIVAFDPYDQNASSPFFDAEWMFGLTNGFDIVIGNPPWGSSLSSEEKTLFKNYYPEIDSSTPNSFAYFAGWAYRHFKSAISYVLPDSILIKDYEKTRCLLKENISEIVWYENSGVPVEYRPFTYVDHDVCIINLNKKESSKLRYSLYRYDSSSKQLTQSNYIQPKDKIIIKEFGYAYNLIIQKVDLEILDILTPFHKLDGFLQCHEGIHTGNSRDQLFHRCQKNKTCFPLFYGSSAGDTIDNYVSKTSGWYVDYRKSIIDKKKGFYASLRDENIFSQPKIYISRTGNPFKAFYDVNNYASNNFFSLQHKSYECNNPDFLKFILPLINSKIAQYFIRKFAAPRIGATFVETKIIHLLKFRIPLDTEYKPLLVNFSEYIITLKMYLKNSAYFERLMEDIVYELYFPTMIKTFDCEIIKHVTLHPTLKDDWSDEKKLKTISAVYNELSNPAHPVSIAMEKIKNIPEVRIIEGLDK